MRELKCDWNIFGLSGNRQVPATIKSGIIYPRFSPVCSGCKNLHFVCKKSHSWEMVD